jgi:hypothetical protein
VTSFRPSGCRKPATICSDRGEVDYGFSLAEFLICTLILLVVAASVFSIVNRAQRVAAYQAEIQGVLESTRYAIMVMERIFQQAGNDPHSVGFPGISGMSATVVRVRADLTGSAATASPPDPDKGDPDGDTLDSGEDVTIQFDASTRTIYLNGQPFVSNIAAFSLQYFDKNGGNAATGDQVTKIRIILTGQSPFRDPQTGRVFSMQLSSDVQLLDHAV